MLLGLSLLKKHMALEKEMVKQEAVGAKPFYRPEMQEGANENCLGI